MKYLQKLFLSKKGTRLSKKNTMTLFVHLDANKTEIKKEIEKYYKIKVAKVNILREEGKKVVRRTRKRFITGKKKRRKKVYVSIKAGEKFNMQRLEDDV